MDTMYCKHCGNSLIENVNHSDDSYEIDICDDCFDKYYGYCDNCGALFEYYNDMINHNINDCNVVCKTCLTKYSQ